MIPPTLIRKSLYNNPIWYDTNIPLPNNREELLILQAYWKNRWRRMYSKATVKDPLNWIHFRMIYSRWFEIYQALQNYDS